MDAFWRHQQVGGATVPFRRKVNKTWAGGGAFRLAAASALDLAVIHCGCRFTVAEASGDGFIDTDLAAKPLFWPLIVLFWGA